MWKNRSFLTAGRLTNTNEKQEYVEVWEKEAVFGWWYERGESEKKKSWGLEGMKEQILVGP